MLYINNLKKSFNKKEVLKNISIHVEPKEIFGFIGHNGAGKTTTIKCIVGILDFEEGNILINGNSIKENPIACKKELAYIPDNPDIYEYMSAIKYLEFIAGVFQMNKDLFNERVNALAKDFEIYERLGDEIKSYSHGMKQKLVLISALMHTPKLLILDEPFVGLDPKSSFILKNKMRELCAAGSSIFFSTHVLEVAQKLCDKIAIIKDGEIILHGETDSIISDDKSLEDIFLELEG